MKYCQRRHNGSEDSVFLTKTISSTSEELANKLQEKIQTVALLSRLLMQFVCLNTVLNPVIYALSHKEFKLGLFHRRRRPCWPRPHAGLDSPWGHFTIAEASVLPSSNFTLWFTRQKGGQVLISKSNKNFTCITTLQLPGDPIFVSKRIF